MRAPIDEQRRYAFRDWLRAELRRLEFYHRRGDRYLISEFWRYTHERGAQLEEVSVGRYLRDENPVLPTPESCRELALALGRHPTEVLLEAGYLTADDFYWPPETDATIDDLRRQVQEIDHYTYLPAVIRAQMKRSVERRLAYLGVDQGHSLPPIQREGYGYQQGAHGINSDVRIVSTDEDSRAD